MTTPFTVLWLQAGSCGGCTMSALSADDVGLVPALERFGIQLLWHPSLSQQTGHEVVELLTAIADGQQSVDALCIEGAVLTGPHGTGRFQILSGTGKPMSEWIQTLAKRVKYVVAVGSCAAYGGFPAAGINRTDAVGVQTLEQGHSGLLPADFRSRAGLPVINIPGCAPHPGWIIETLADLSLGEMQLSSLDSLARPRAFADHLAHHGCGRNEFYEFKASAARPSDRGCLMENLGCKATQAPGDCNIRRWNGHGSCTDAGYTCISCTTPGFQDPGSSFLETPKRAGIPVGLPLDMPKAWFVALAALSKSATPSRVRTNAHADHIVVPPVRHPAKGKQ